MTRKSQKLTIAMIVLNEEEFLWHNLSQHYGFADEIIILEGADRRYPNELVTPDGMSKDKTREIIKSFPDPDGKIKYFPLGWTTKNDMAKIYIGMIKEGWFLRIDGDEFYTRESQQNIRKHINTTDKDVLIYPIYHLWKGHYHHIVGGFYSVPHMKLMRITEGCNFNLDHVRLCYADGRLYVSGLKIQDVKVDDIYMVHLGFARRDAVRYKTNVQYYINVGEKQSRPEYIRAREMWDSEEIDRQYKIYAFTQKLPEYIKARYELLNQG